MKIEIAQNLNLQLIELKHSQELFDLVMLNKNYLRQWLPWVDNMQSADFIINFINGSVLRNINGNEFAFVIMLENKIAGRIGIYKIDNQNKIGEIGYWISHEIQGKGIVTTCCSALINYCFNQLQLNRIEIKCASQNLKSQAIPIRLNFKLEGTIRQGELVHNNFVDLRLYSLIKEDWQQPVRN